MLTTIRAPRNGSRGPAREPCRDLDLDTKGVDSGHWSNVHVVQPDVQGRRMYSRSNAAWASTLTLKVSTWSKSLHPLSSPSCVSRDRMELNSTLISICVCNYSQFSPQAGNAHLYPAS